MRSYLRAAKTHDILVFFVLWNGAQPSTAPMVGLITDVPKLRSYVTVLRQMVNQLKDEPALGGWELMNEPEGIVRGLQDNTEPCFSTKKFHGGWAIDSHTNWRPDQVRNKYSMFELQRYVVASLLVSRSNTAAFCFIMYTTYAKSMSNIGNDFICIIHNSIYIFRYG